MQPWSGPVAAAAAPAWRSCRPSVPLRPSRSGGRRLQRLRLAAVGKHLDPVLDADRQRLTADRAASAMGERFLRREPHLTLAMPVEVILAFVGEELDRAGIAVAGLQRMFD